MTHSSFRIYQHNDPTRYQWTKARKFTAGHKTFPKYYARGNIYESLMATRMHEGINSHRQNIYCSFSLLHKLRTISTISLILALNISKFPWHIHKFAPWNYYWEVIFVSHSRRSSFQTHSQMMASNVVIWICSKTSKLTIIIAFNHLTLCIVLINIEQILHGNLNIWDLHFDY